KQEHLSEHFTTSWDDILTINLDNHSFFNNRKGV
ncbi:MAG: DUF4113 domain-containing protein, partial [Candidatus Kapaibacteriota bacterium]